MTAIAIALGAALAVVAVAIARLRERRRRQQDRRAILVTRERLYVSLASAGVSAFATGRDGHIRWFEGPALPGTATGRSALLGRSAWDALRRWPGITAALRAALAGEEGVHRIDIGESAVRVSYAPRSDDCGRVVEAIVVIRDVTAERDETEHREHLDEMRSRVLDVMRYRLRGQVHAVAGATGLASRLDGEAFASRLATADEAARRVLRSVEHLVDVLELDAGRLALDVRPFLLRQIVDDLASSFARRAEAGGTRLLVRYPPGVPDEFEGDPDRVRQTLELLLAVALNANQGGQVGQDVELGVEAGRESAGRESTEGTPVLRVAISVEDGGPGLSAEAQSRRFDVFESASAMWATPPGGSGLELPLAQRLAEALGGDLTTDSEPGGRSALRLELELPLAQGRSTAREGAGAPALEVGTMLLVDHDGLQRATTRALAEQLGWSVIEAGDGAEAWSILEGGRGVGCVVTELHMPASDGFALISHLARTTPDGHAATSVPVIVLTADTRATSRTLALRRGAAAVLLKPAGLEELERALAEAAAAWRSPAPEGVGADGERARAALLALLERLETDDTGIDETWTRVEAGAGLSSAELRFVGRDAASAPVATTTDVATDDTRELGGSEVSLPSVLQAAKRGDEAAFRQLLGERARAVLACVRLAVPGEPSETATRELVRHAWRVLPRCEATDAAEFDAWLLDEIASVVVARRPETWPAATVDVWTLPAALRETVLLREVFAHRPEEIARVFEQPLETVEAWYRRGLERLAA
ncbi:MAG: response regulator [Dehalococcoidia bacterium]